ncbi:adenosine monophosphate-protein transferase [Zhengella mangrovi]|uniref:protein adenylyltransferase n=1 Tax=Zhengella mangrovi TaxID=1982044 RepID=A0A2G1QGX6_9HYPH|nr:Fic family protein [Zhengella mangrovi]PHP64704.1 adenosine monophosphate-protein transferase [Zhengella mangrovi]
MYEAIRDPYCYPNSTVLRNRAELREAKALEDFELAFFTQRFEEGLPHGRLGVAHLRAIHRHLFQDVYEWAGQYRTVRIAKGGTMFCYPENIASQLDELLGSLKSKKFLAGLSDREFAKAAAHVLADLNAIHPFRDGNGRTQMAFMSLVAQRAGHEFDLAKIKPRPFLAAMIASFSGQEDDLETQLLALMQ